MRRLILTPRWIVWHVLTLGAMISCGLLAAWQWHRAGEAMGSALNIGYGLQWPFFAIFFGVMWWRMLRMEAAQLAAAPQAPKPVPTPAPVADGPAPFGPRPVIPAAALDEDDPDDRRLAAYNRALAEITAHDATRDGR